MTEFDRQLNDCANSRRVIANLTRLLNTTSYLGADAPAIVEAKGWLDLLDGQLVSAIEEVKFQKKEALKRPLEAPPADPVAPKLAVVEAETGKK